MHKASIEETPKRSHSEDKMLLHNRNQGDVVSPKSTGPPENSFSTLWIALGFRVWFAAGLRRSDSPFSTVRPCCRTLWIVLSCMYLHTLCSHLFWDISHTAGSTTVLLLNFVVSLILLKNQFEFDSDVRKNWLIWRLWALNRGVLSIWSWLNSLTLALVKVMKILACRQ